jgi:pimeloyl-ACP methyl ester carboxylesterase
MYNCLIIKRTIIASGILAVIAFFAGEALYLRNSPLADFVRMACFPFFTLVFLLSLFLVRFRRISPNPDVYLYDQIGSGWSDRLDDIRQYTALRHKKDLEAIVQAIGAEKVILIGQSWGKEYLDLFPHHELVVVPDAGHGIFVEQPALYLSAIRAFLRAREQ